MLFASVEMFSSSDQECKELSNQMKECKFLLKKIAVRIKPDTLTDFETFSNQLEVCDLRSFLLQFPEAAHIVFPKLPSQVRGLYSIFYNSNQNIKLLWFFLRIFIESGVDPNAGDTYQNSLLFNTVKTATLYKNDMQSIIMNDLYKPLIRYLIEMGANPHQREREVCFVGPKTIYGTERTTPFEMMPDLIKEIEKELKVKKAAEAVEAAEAIALAALSIECASGQEPSRRPCGDFAADVARMLQLSSFCYA